MQDRHQPIDLLIGEEGIGSVGRRIRERRLVQPRDLDNPVGGEVLDDELNEVDLVGRVVARRQELLEGLGGGLPVEADERTDEQAQPLALFLRTRDVTACAPFSSSPASRAALQTGPTPLTMGCTTFQTRMRATWLKLSTRSMAESVWSGDKPVYDQSWAGVRGSPVLPVECVPRIDGAGAETVGDAGEFT